MASLRRNKTDKNDSFKLALLGATQLTEIKNHCNKQSTLPYDSLRILSLRYKQLIKCRTRILNFLRSSLELTFPELNQIFKRAYAVLALHEYIKM